MHWNVLADFLAHDFEKVPELYLKWEYRFPMIIDHIKNVDADIVGLSEVDCYPIFEQYQEEMQKLGYMWFFHEKSDRKSGSAIFYKKEKFTCMQVYHLPFNSEDTHFLLYGRFQLKTEAKHEFIFG